MTKRIPYLFLEGVEVLPGRFRNFAGRKDQYNKAGDRNFNVILTDESNMSYETGNERNPYRQASIQDLIDDGWNIRLMKPRDNDDPDEPKRYKLNIKVDFEIPKTIPSIPKPVLVLHSGRKETLLDEETADTLDYADYNTMDLTVRPRLWTTDNGERKIKAYLGEAHVVIRPSRWADKYKREEDDGDDLPF